MQNVHPRLKEGVVPHIFACQTEKVPPVRKVAVERHRKRLVDEAVQEVREKISKREIQEPVPSTSKDYPTVAVGEETEFSETGEEVG